MDGISLLLIWWVTSILISIIISKQKG